MSSVDRITAEAGTRRTYAPDLAPSVAAAPTQPFQVGRTRLPRTRRTVDLTPAQHRALDIWQREAADRLAVARVTGQEVLASLVDQLLNDPKLSAQIIRNLQAARR